MTSTTAAVDCGYDHDDDKAICDLCDRKIVPVCSTIRIRAGHMESPEGESAFDVCLDCASSRPGFVEAIAMLTAAITDKWEAKKRPRREFRKARAELNERYREATSGHRQAFELELAKLASEHERTTGENLSVWDRKLDWCNPF
jgi:ribosome-binding protein aMBF1 (putative translation factor)